MSLVTIVSLIMVGLILLLVFNVGGNIVSIFSNQGPQNALEVGKIVNELYFLEGMSSGEALHRAIPLTDKDLFLFFSAGNGPIFLKGKNDFESKQFIFLRPDVEDCNGKACLCHCGAGPYWKTTKDTLSFQYLFEGEPYLCPEDYLTCQTINNDVVQFGNSRGQDAFYEDFFKKIKRTPDTIYHPIPLDIVVLGQTTLGGEVSDDYAADGNRPKNWFTRNFLDLYYLDQLLKGQPQEKEHVESLLADYSWKGGVVIGGTGLPIAKDNKIKAVSVTLRMERANDFIYGICLHEQCFFEPQNQQETEAEIFSLARFYLEEQQETSMTAARYLSTNCFSDTLSEDEQISCQETLFDVAFFAEPSTSADEIILNDIAQQLVLWSFQHLYLLEFSSLGNDRWEITPQLLVTASCEEPDYATLMKQESFVARLPITFSNSETPETFFVLHKEQSDEGIQFHVSTQGIQDMCESIQSFEGPVFDPLEHVVPLADEFPSALNYIKLFSEVFTINFTYDADTTQLQFTPSTSSPAIVTE